MSKSTQDPKTKKPAVAKESKSFRATFSEGQAEAVGFAIKSAIRAAKSEKNTDAQAIAVTKDLVARLESAYAALDKSEEISRKTGSTFFD